MKTKSEYRIVKHDERIKIWFAVHRVFYGKNGGEINEIVEQAVTPKGYGKEELMSELKMMIDAYSQPVISMKAIKERWSAEMNCAKAQKVKSKPY